jgi:DNA-binding NarL/FixJ family response regulator
MPRTRILVVDDHLIVRQGLRWMLGDHEVEIVAEAETGAGALEALAESRPDVILLDILLPDRSGLDVLADLHEQFPDLPVLILSMSDDAENVESAVRAGAAGYLLKNAPREELLRAIQAAAAGDAYLQAEVARPILSRFADEVRARADAPALSPREIDVLTLVAEGLTDRQIGSRLGIGETTVKGYLRGAYEKLGAADRAQAVAIALRGGLIR